MATGGAEVIPVLGQSSSRRKRRKRRFLLMRNLRAEITPAPLSTRAPQEKSDLAQASRAVVECEVPHEQEAPVAPPS